MYAPGRSAGDTIDTPPVRALARRNGTSRNSPPNSAIARSEPMSPVTAVWSCDVATAHALAHGLLYAAIVDEGSLPRTECDCVSCTANYRRARQ